MTQAANLGALGTNVSSSGIAQAAGGGTAGTAGVTGFKNRLINGDMQIWQRGTTYTGTGAGASQYGSVDRWAFGQFPTAYTSARSTDVPTGAGFQYSLKIQRTAGQTSTAQASVIQAIESVNMYDLAGQTVTLSFWAKRGANFSMASSALGVLLTTGTVADQGSYASQGGWTGQAYPVNTAQVLTTSWQKFTFTGAFGSTALEAAVYFYMVGVGTAGADDSFFITGVQLEAGSTATNFDFLSFGTELMLCQRYYQKSFPQATAPAQNTGIYSVQFTMVSSGYGTYQSFYFPVVMRVAPTITGFNGGAANNLYRDVPGATNITTLLLLNESTAGFTSACYGGGSDFTGARIGWNWTASAEL
jgi:hypothetical protein